MAGRAGRSDVRRPLGPELYWHAPRRVPAHRRARLPADPGHQRTVIALPRHRAPRTGSDLDADGRHRTLRHSRDHPDRAEAAARPGRPGGPRRRARAPRVRDRRSPRGGPETHPSEGDPRPGERARPEQRAGDLLPVRGPQREGGRAPDGERIRPCLESQRGSAEVARGRRPVAEGLLSRSSLVAPVISPRLALLLLVALCAGCVGDRSPEGGPGAAIPAGVEGVRAEETAPAAAPAVEPVGAQTAASSPSASPVDAAPSAPIDIGARPVFQRPEHVRALYLNAWASGSRKRVAELVEVARRTEVNAFVIDIKDASGYVSHRTDVSLAREIGATGEIRISDLPGLLRKLEAEGIYPIARIVIVRDPLLAEARPNLAVQSSAGGPWHDDKGIVWMNIAQKGLWDYNVDLAEEVVRMGFPEVQWDYVRFPDAPRAVMVNARFPGLEGGKPDAVRGFLEYADKRLDELDLDVAMTADVFGITTTTVDVGIGQIWERFIDKVDVALPMVYPSHYYKGSFGIQSPNAFPYEIVRKALERALERSKAVEGAGRIRPWLQDFNLGAPAYGAPEVRAQIQATYDAGLEEWVLWNAGSKYTEGALQPADGWAEEPLIRVADRVIPVSKRFDVLAAAKTENAETRAPRPAPETRRPDARAPRVRGAGRGARAGPLAAARAQARFAAPLDRLHRPGPRHGQRPGALIAPTARPS
ncbi:MAG: hypothetical protein EXR95_05760 [Gemmatimonadetes bacterium]|nr:hypothetical protein [Gemmatimonadota bacterium]